MTVVIRRMVALVAAARRWMRQRLCPLFNGGHELYPARTSDRLFQECLLCRYKTRGWELEAAPKFRSRLAGRKSKRLREVGRGRAA